MLECHGSLRCLQCSTPCCDDVWDWLDDLGLSEHPQTHCAVGDLPKCPRCGAVARPAVLMFGQDKEYRTTDRRFQQSFYDPWQERCRRLLGDRRQPSVVCLEIGCGVTVRTVRKELEKVFGEYPGAKLIRINPEDCGVPRAFGDRAVSLPMEGLEALEKLDALLPKVEMAKFIVHDYGEHGAEVQMPKESTVDTIFARVAAEVDWHDCGDPKQTAARSIVERNKFQLFSRGDRVPIASDLFGKVLVNDEMPVVEVCFGSVEFHNVNLECTRRLGIIFFLLQDLIHHFGCPKYQAKLEEVQSRSGLRDLIRTVHLKVLPRFGWAVTPESTASQWASAQMSMQAFIQAGEWFPVVGHYSGVCQHASGAHKMQELPLRDPRKDRKK